MTVGVGWQEFRNDSGEVIPAHGIVRVTGVAEISSRRLVLTAEKPNDYGGTTMHFVNGPRDIPAGRFGVCNPAATPVWAKYDRSTDPQGKFFGPDDGDWTLQKNVPGFRCIGIGETNDSLILVIREPVGRLLVRLDEDLNNVGTAEATPMHWDEALGGYAPDSSRTVTVREILTTSGGIDSGLRCWCEWEVTLQGWVVTAAACN